MPEYHPGTDVVIPDNVPMSHFRNAIPNTKRYMKHNNVSISDVSEAAYTGDYDLLEEMLSTGDEKMLYNGDINAHVTSVTALMMAAMSGQLECVELLLKANADPHIKETMTYGQDPEDGRTALDFAKEAGYDDISEILEQAEKDYKYGWYLPAGKTNNAKMYRCWQWPSKPTRGFFSSRPGAAELAGFDPMKYGTGPLPEENETDDFVEPGAVSGASRPKPVAGLPAGLPPIPVGLLFPGQGSQYVKMMSTVKDIPAVREMCTKANHILGYDVLELCLEGPEEMLEETRYCQPAMFLAGLAGIEKLKADREEAGTRFQACAGLSLGEYTALCAAGVFTFEDGLKLVKLRGEAMQEAAQQGKQLMLSVAGLDKMTLEQMCKECAKKAGGVCQIANELFPKGFSCAGTDKAIIALKEAAEKRGALQAKLLKTSGAFHTELMGPARDELSKALDEALPRMSPPKHIVYSNVTAQPLKVGTDPKDVVQLLKQQLTSPVLWEPLARNMIKAGITEFYEVGPMKQIKAMMKRIDPKVWNFTSNVEV
mmetsp:Transcript_85318/g.222020  ORF Transcript_85318/g.222020 Transcript_85318/m.222020 type:complete len:540 (+) Transcript_85318:56-1675(+)|eukprot:CAMPEP_0115226892 /NCGR_PEP_ID=MMETSP0270-20121206/30864_1 /TAXON_ID=71861 /ORGANISM="Scrippsiella trochoidea, Strain CCMP3099" /LENGTH=539 /DNA_ID=CAMNT_0002641327 /DNA_START=56 /DNA_END=1675 /DNA_ORIENTATION=+